VLDAERGRLPFSPLPLRVVARLEWFLAEEGFDSLTFNLATEKPATEEIRADVRPEGSEEQ
jgi:hypothetical protein